MRQRAPGGGLHPLARLAGRWWFWALLVGFIGTAAVARTLAVRRVASLPVYWSLPPFDLTDQDARPFGAAQLRGHPYIADFIFTTCVLECPRLTRQMAHLQPDLARYAGRVHLVSFTVDPADDTPERLHAYALQNHADPHTWHFLTGSTDGVMHAVEDGFRAEVDMPTRAPDGTFNPIALAHSNRFMLVDGAGRLRGIYPADDDGVHRLLEGVATLDAEH